MKNISTIFLGLGTGQQNSAYVLRKAKPSFGGQEVKQTAKKHGDGCLTYGEPLVY